MRPDLIRLLVDTNRKDLVVREDKANGGVIYTRTIDRVGLSLPLDSSAPEPETENWVSIREYVDLFAGL